MTVSRSIGVINGLPTTYRAIHVAKPYLGWHKATTLAAEIHAIMLTLSTDSISNLGKMLKVFDVNWSSIWFSFIFL
jgi:hypothetical protein